MGWEAWPVIVITGEGTETSCDWVQTWLRSLALLVMASVVDSGVMTRAIVLCLATLLTSCAVKVAPSDLIGQWVMRDESVKLLGLKLRPCFTLESDGTLRAEDLPASASSDSQQWRQIYSGSGVWTVPPVRRTEGFSLVALDFKRSGPNEPTDLTLQVDKDSGGLYVFAWLD